MHRRDDDDDDDKEAEADDAEAEAEMDSALLHTSSVCNVALGDVPSPTRMTREVRPCSNPGMKVVRSAAPVDVNSTHPSMIVSSCKFLLLLVLLLLFSF